MQTDFSSPWMMIRWNNSLFWYIIILFSSINRKSHRKGSIIYNIPHQKMLYGLKGEVKHKNMKPFQYSWMFFNVKRVLNVFVWGVKGHGVSGELNLPPVRLLRRPDWSLPSRHVWSGVEGAIHHRDARHTQLQSHNREEAAERSTHVQ